MRSAAIWLSGAIFSIGFPTIRQSIACATSPRACYRKEFRPNEGFAQVEALYANG